MDDGKIAMTRHFVVNRAHCTVRMLRVPSRHLVLFLRRRLLLLLSFRFYFPENITAPDYTILVSIVVQ